jgi:TonB family protein
LEETTWFNNKRIRFGIIFSLIFHAFIIQMKISQDHSASLPLKNDYVEVTLDDMKELRKSLSPASSKTKSSAKKQIVNNELTGQEIKPIDSQFLGEKDQTYDRQTIASKVDLFNKAALGQRTGLVNGEKTQELTKSAPKVATPKTMGVGKKMTLNDLSLSNENLTEAINKAESLNTAKLGVKNGDSASRGLSSNNDFIETVPLGDFTHLNTTEFKYYGFYHRIRQKLEQFWGNSIREKAKTMYMSGRRIPATENLITSITVDINHKGEIVHVKVIGTSGVRELDEAAVESFNKAGPFPNPPQGMLKNGVATIEWGFVVKS